MISKIYYSVAPIEIATAIAMAISSILGLAKKVRDNR